MVLIYVHYVQIKTYPEVTRVIAHLFGFVSYKGYSGDSLHPMLQHELLGRCLGNLHNDLERGRRAARRVS